VFGVVVDADVEECGSEPGERDGHIGDSSEHDLSVEMLDQMLMQATQYQTNHSLGM